MSYELRPYQQKAITDTRDSFIQGYKHICICLSVGAGKSLIAKIIIDQSLSKNKKIGFFSFRTALIKQMKKHFPNDDNIVFGTLQKHGKDTKTEYDLIIVDEKDFHDTKLKNSIKAKYSITLSGTPVTADGYPLKFDKIIDGVQLPDLINQGYAKPLKILSISKIDTSKLKKVGSDFHKGQSFEIMEKSTIKKDIIDTYKKYCIGRKSLLFAIDINHCESLKKEFLDNGIKCESIHSKKKVDNILNDFENDKFDLLINVDMISVGVDIPSINTIIFARPMLSIPLMIQCIGRGTRINPNKKDDYCLILDLAEVFKRTNHHPMQKLDFNRTKQTKKQKTCTCGTVMYIAGKSTQRINDLEFKSITRYICKNCNRYEDVEKISIINLNFCKQCDNVLTDADIQMVENKKSLDFIIKCDHCGCENSQRTILLTDAELKELEYNEIMNGEDNWIKVKKILLQECKKWNYNHRYSIRLIEHLQNKQYTPTDSIKMIKELQSANTKISKLMIM